MPGSKLMYNSSVQWMEFHLGEWEVGCGLGKRARFCDIGKICKMASSTPWKSFTRGNQQPSNGSVSDKRSSGGYDIGELATSSLLGLLATIKDHITKPTAMAQGRVAHLIEWKSWGGEATSGGSWCGWSREAGGATLQEDEQLYSHLTDEIKEARFAAGVAEQFALAEAAMNGWSAQDIENQVTNSTIPLQDTESLYLSQFLLDGGSLGVPQHMYRMHMEVEDSSSLAPSHPRSHSHSPSDTLRPPREHRISPSEASMRLADCISLSEDEVFYN
ncbi:hypothetical protein DNTS_030293 [Danionella cerebrum]|uniref:Family with sequence similarity 131 member C n=1 Tax=Danionella cerebrum TaxID=2873325 RepID=A0A553RJV5_9TELE|nr:hypothetical protein DNTS_030293 [Danionella translucida]